MKLQEIDVLGWELLKPTQYCTVSILNRWLSCRGAKVSGKRLKELIKRCDSVIRTILGDRGAVSQAGGKGATNVFKHSGKSPSVPTLTESQTVKRMPAPDWAQKMIWKFLLSSFREFVHDGYYLATVALFVHQAFLTRNEGTTDESKNVSDAISRSNSICTEKILFLTDHNVS